MFTEQDNQLIEKEFEVLRLASLKRCANQGEYETVLKAFDFAKAAHNGVRRRSGEPYIIHPISVAQIVVQEIGLGYKSIVAALVHDVVEDTEYTLEDIERFSPHLLEEIGHYFETYKHLQGKKVQVIGWEKTEAVKKEILISQERYRVTYGD